MNRSVRVFLIGCGAVSDLLYVPALAQLNAEGRLQVAGVIDPELTRRGSIAATLDVPGFETFGTARESQEADLAIVAAPARFHAELAVEALEAGLSVLCEKPMATTTDACDRMNQAAADANRCLAVGLFRRFFPSCQMVKELLSQGALGAVQSFHFQEGETYSWPARSSAGLLRSQSGGGVLIDAGAHTIDLLLWWLGDVAALEYQDDAMGGVEANCVLRLRMASGAHGIVQLSRDWPLPNQYRIQCERGWITYTCDVVDRLEWGFSSSVYNAETVLRRRPEADQHDRNGVVPQFFDCFVNQLRDVVDAVAIGRSPTVTGAEAKRSVALIESCYRERRLMPMPWLSPHEFDAAIRLSNA